MGAILCVAWSCIWFVTMLLGGLVFGYVLTIKMVPVVWCVIALGCLTASVLISDADHNDLQDREVQKAMNEFGSFEHIHTVLIMTSAVLALQAGISITIAWATT